MRRSAIGLENRCLRRRRAPPQDLLVFGALAQFQPISQWYSVCLMVGMCKLSPQARRPVPTKPTTSWFRSAKLISSAASALWRCKGCRRRRGGASSHPWRAWAEDDQEDPDQEVDERVEDPGVVDEVAEGHRVVDQVRAVERLEGVVGVPHEGDEEQEGKASSSRRPPGAARRATRPSPLPLNGRTLGDG